MQCTTSRGTVSRPQPGEVSDDQTDVQLARGRELRGRPRPQRAVSLDVGPRTPTAGTQGGPDELERPVEIHDSPSTTPLARRRTGNFQCLIRNLGRVIAASGSPARSVSNDRRRERIWDATGLSSPARSWQVVCHKNVAKLLRGLRCPLKSRSVLVAPGSMSHSAGFDASRSARLVRGEISCISTDPQEVSFFRCSQPASLHSERQCGPSANI